MEQNQLESEKTVNELYVYVANRIVKDNRAGYQVKTELMEKGMPEEAVNKIVDHVEQQIYQARRDRASKDMLYGALWCIGGTVVTVATYSAASGGGRYVVAWGAIIFGAIQFFKGLANATSS